MIFKITIKYDYYKDDSICSNFKYIKFNNQAINGILFIDIVYKKQWSIKYTIEEIRKFHLKPSESNYK